MNDARGALALGARLISIKAWAFAGLAAFIAVISLMAPVALVALTNTGSGTESGSPLAATGVSDAVPAAYRDDVLKAGNICAGVSPALIAAQIAAESNWDENAGSHAGAQGISQFMPATWNGGAGMDGDGDGKADINNPHDAIYSQGNYMCAKLKEVDALLTAQSVAGDRIELALAAYNAGTGAVESAGGIPINGETEKYVPKIINAIPTYQGADGSLLLASQSGIVSGEVAEAIDWAQSIANDDSHGYVWGAAGPENYDCSGFTMQFMARRGITLPHYADTQARMGVEIPESQAKPGDLIFWSNDNGRSYYHAAIFIGNGQMISADSPAQGINVEAIWGRDQHVIFRTYANN
nr:bifunctional lytic transglycosylase/C40 family peptidase [uncultured Actinomyces sp.]